MTGYAIPEGDFLTLPRALVEDGRHPEAVAAYERALKLLVASGDDRGVIVGKYELVHVALHTNDLELAERIYDEMLLDLERSDFSLTPVESLMLPLMFRVARGDTDDVLEALEEFREGFEGDVSLDEMITMLQFGAEVHELRGSPLQASYLLLQIAQMCERAAHEHELVDLRRMTAETYLDHAIFLVTNKAQCLLEAESGLADELPDIEPEVWEAFLAEALDERTANEDLLAALHQRVLRSLDASDRWGPAAHGVRFSAGKCRVHILLEMDRIEAAVVEARRIVPIADLAGDIEGAHSLRACVAIFDTGIEGPDFER